MLSKRLTALLLAVIIAFSFTGCGEGIKEYLWPEPTTASPGAPTSNIKIIPGWSIYQIAKALEEGNVCSAKSFLEAANKIPEGYDNLIEGLSSSHGYVFAAEGYILPETYNMYQEKDGEYALRYFLNYTKKAIDELSNEDGQTAYSKAEELGYSMHDVMTLASIIQYEANLGSSAEDFKNMCLVSSVFHNRLNNHALFPYIGSDATRKYIQSKLGDYFVDNDIYKLNPDATDSDDKYIIIEQATYDAYLDGYCTNDNYDHKTQGLPIGPVGSPSISAIKAALWPENSNYYFFFTDADNGFHFYNSYNDFQTEWDTKYKH